MERKRKCRTSGRGSAGVGEGTGLPKWSRECRRRRKLELQKECRREWQRETKKCRSSSEIDRVPEFRVGLGVIGSCGLGEIPK